MAEPLPRVDATVGIQINDKLSDPDAARAFLERMLNLKHEYTNVSVWVGPPGEVLR